MNLYLNLFLTLAKISLQSFGGGYAVLPLLQRELVDKKGWLSQEDLGDLFAIAQCTPGVIIVNSATYVGAHVGRTKGAICATVGVLTPPVTIILLVAAFLWPFLEAPWVVHALAGLQVCVCALILSAVVKLLKQSVIDLPSLLIFLLAGGLSFFTSVSPAFLVLAAGLVGFALGRLRNGGGKR